MHSGVSSRVVVSVLREEFPQTPHCLPGRGWGANVVLRHASSDPAEIATGMMGGLSGLSLSVLLLHALQEM